ncbi:MAG: WD40 repeat domain-containing protein [bacterium]|nr:WD40 repeat domain-containing protein [bacterium]
MVNKRMLRSVLFTLLLCVLLVGTGQAQNSQQVIRNLPPMAVLDVQYSPDGRYIARVYAQGRLEVLEAASNRTVLEDTVALPHPLQRAKVDWSPTGDQLAAGIGAQIYIWDVGTTQLLETINAGGSEPLVYFEDGSFIPEGFVSLQWNSTGLLLMAKSMSSRFTIWSKDQLVFIVDQVTGNNPVPIVWLADDRHISNGTSVFDIQDPTSRFIPRQGQPLEGVLNNCGPYSSIATNANRTLIVQATIYDCIVITDAFTGDEIGGYQISEILSLYENDLELIEHMNPIWDVSWSPDESVIIAVDSQGAVRVVDIATGSVTLIAQQSGPLYAVDWADTNTAIAYGGSTLGEDTVFATVSVAEVDRLMMSAARQPEFAITPAADR